MIRIFYCQNSAPEIPEEISDHRKSKIEKARHPDEKTRMILASNVLKAGFESFKISEKDVSYAFTENGKPYVSSHPEINFSLSHTKNFAIAAFSEHEVGIDCESSGREIPARVLSKLFTKKETLSFDSEPILLWTAKESVSKLTGYGVGGFNAIPELEYFSEKTEINGIFLRKLNVGEFTVVISSFTDDDISLTELK